MECGFENRGVVRGSMGGLGEGCGSRVIGQDKASTVSHGALLRFGRLLLSFSHRTRTVRTVRTPLAEVPRFASVSVSIRSLPKLLSFAAVSTILIAGLGLVARQSGLVIALTDSSCPVGIYRLVRKSGGRGLLVESCLPYAIASYGIDRGYIGSGDCPGGTEPVVKMVGAVSGDLVELSRTAVSVNGWNLANSASIFRDSRGREVRRVAFNRYQTGANQVWLFGLNDLRSWDSRYFGPIPDRFIRGALQPVLTVAR